MLRSFLPDADRIGYSFLDSISFIDAGANWAGVECPYCRKDVEDWWQRAMSRAHEAQFENLVVKLPCCSRTSSLNNLNYGWTVAFGSWVLEARNPNRPGLDRDEIEDLSEIVGERLTQVADHI